MYKMGKTLNMTQSEGKIYCLFFISIMPRVKLRKFYIFGNLNHCICLGDTENIEKESQVIECYENEKFSWIPKCCLKNNCHLKMALVDERDNQKM